MSDTPTMRGLMDLVESGGHDAHPAAELRRRVAEMSLPARIKIIPWHDQGRFKNVAEVTDLEAPDTGKGMGRATMEAVCRTADELGVTLFAWPVPDDDVEGALSGGDLTAWYKRLGFTEMWEDEDDDNEWRMVRQPRSA